MFRPRCATLIVSLVSGIAFAGAAIADDVVIKHFSAGTGADSVGIVEAGEDIELSGPQAMNLDSDGNVFLLDQVNGRILKFNPKQPGEEPAVLKMPDDVQPTDLVVRSDDILVWDGSIRTLKAAAQSTRSAGKGPVVLEEITTRGVDDQVAISAFAQTGSQSPGAASELLDEGTRAVTVTKKRQLNRQFVASRGKGSVVADIVPGKSESSVRIEVRSKDNNQKLAEFDLRVRNRLGSVEFLEIDNSGRLYVMAEDIPESSRQPSTFVARFSPEGKLEGIYELPLANTPLTRRFVAISGDGDLYFLRTKADVVAVVGVGFRRMTSAVIDIRTAQVDPALPGSMRRFGAIAAVRPSNRQQVVEMAFAFEGVQWNLSPANYGSDPDSSCTGFNRIRRPWYLQGKVNQQVRGVPYCWGCHGSLANFRALIDRGTKAGNVCTRDTPRSDVVGVDCSAFVSATWGLSVHYTTAAIPAIAKPIDNPWDLKPGDALNKPGSHVMLFLRFTPDRKAEVMEAATGGCNGRVCRNVYPLAGLLARGYTPVRFRALAEDQTQVSAVTYQDDTAGKKGASRKR